MILLDKPYVSAFLKQTIADENLPVLKTEQLDQFSLAAGANVWEQEAALERFRREGVGLLYSNSENALGWMMSNLQFSELPQQITLFKDKIAFRKLLEPLYPDFFYEAVLFDELSALDIGKLTKPFIIKPAVGFFSMGVHRVSDDSEWPGVLAAVRAEITAVQTLYPLEVLDTTRFIIEQNVEGEEFAIDAYYNGAGQAVLLNILHHWFPAHDDVRDRVYITSREIMARYSARFKHFLQAIGRAAGLKNFPVHAEVRIDAQGHILPIEINPMRFAGWCTTDIAQYAYGINPYTAYFRQEEPDWEKILDEAGDQLYSIIILDKPADIDARAIASFDYEKLCSQFEKPLELRPIDYREYPVFGFLFAETRPQNIGELESILRSDLKEFITTRSSTFPKS